MVARVGAASGEPSNHTSDWSRIDGTPLSTARPASTQASAAGHRGDRAGSAPWLTVMLVAASVPSVRSGAMVSGMPGSMASVRPGTVTGRLGNRRRVSGGGWGGPRPCG